MQIVIDNRYNITKVGRGFSPLLLSILNTGFKQHFVGFVRTSLKRIAFKLILICSLFLTANTYAAEVNIKSFQKGSYQSMLTEYQGQPLVLILWSVTCSACLDEMELIHNIHQQQPKLNMLMLSVDGPEFHQEMTQIIKQAKLTDIDHWSFAEDNSPALRYAIDSQWYGELPRTYFFNAQHDKTGISGVLSPKKYKEIVAELVSNK